MSINFLKSPESCFKPSRLATIIGAPKVNTLILEPDSSLHEFESIPS
jgi:hypothetical protein